MSIPISQLTNGGLPNGNIEIPATNPLNTTQSINGTTFKYILADILQYILIAQGFTTYTSCRVATTAALTATYANGVAGVGATLTNAGAQVALSIDGVTLALNDRVLIKNQINTFENGIYVITDVGSLTSNWVLTRATDYNEPAEIVYLGVVAITQGTQNGSLVFQENSQGPFVIGTSPITFQQLQIDITLLPSASPANKILRSDGSYWVQSTTAELSATDALTNITELQVDNININGNTITSTDVGGDIIITPNTVGSIVLDGLNWPQVDGTPGQAITTDGAGQLGWSTVSLVTTPTTDKAIAIFNGTGGALQNSTITIPASNTLSGVADINDSNNNTAIIVGAAVSAVNYLEINNAPTNNPVTITAEGSDVDVSLYLAGKGSSQVRLGSDLLMYNTSGGNNYTVFSTVATGTKPVTIPDLSGTMAISGASQSVSFGQLDVDNVEINGNTISSTDLNGDLILTPNGTGDLVLDGLNWPQADGTNAQAITTNGAGQLGWSTVSTVTTPTTDKAIAIFNGTSGALQNSTITIPSSNTLSGISTIKDTNGNTSATFIPAASAVNYWGILNSASGNGLALKAFGLDSNINTYFISKGDSTIAFSTEAVTLNPIQILSGTASQHSTSFAFANTASSRIVTFPDLDGTVALSGAGQSVSFGSLSLTTPLGISSGGTNASTIGANGTLAQSDGTKYTFTTATYPSTATATGTILRADGTNWVATTATYPNTTSINHILYSSAANVIGEIADTVGGVLVSNNTGVPSMLANPSDNYRVLQSKNAAIPEWSVAAYPHTAGASGTLMQSDGTDWTNTQATYPGSTNKNHILYSSANNTVGEISTQKNAVLVSDNQSTPQWSGSLSDGQIIIGKTNDLPAAASITGSGSITVTPGANSITISSSASGTVNSGTANQLAYYATTGSAVSGLSTANSATLVTSSTGVPSWTSSMTNGQILIGSTGATPVPATITGTLGITVTNGAGTITISGGGGGYTWTEVTGTTQTMTANNGYITNNPALVTLTLPATAALGTTLSIAGKGAGGWKIAQNAGQEIFFGSSATTIGVTGYLQSTQQFDSIELLCITANTQWTVITGPQGAITVA
jgi:hypothetical protein